jgi:site-specific DNA recombinase
MCAWPPLGYEIEDRRLVAVEREAAIVRRILDRFAKTGSALIVARELDVAGEVTKRRRCADGIRGGKPWIKGAVYKVLANRVYIGEAVHRGVAYPGEHAPLVDQRAWDKAHAVMAEPAHRRGAASRAQVPALLKGLIHGPNGRPMSPSHTRLRGRIYRYYVTHEAIADGYESCPVTSVPAADIEAAVLDHVQKLLAAPELVARTWATARRGCETKSPNARSAFCSPSSPRSGTSCSRPSRRGSCSSSSSGSTCRRTHSRCGSGQRASQA